MRILWVKLGGLWPPTAGGRIRSLETLACLSRHHEVTVVTTHGRDDDPDGLRRRLPHCARIVSVPFVAPRAGTAAFARALATSWCTRHPVDLWKWRAAVVYDEVRSALARGNVDVCVADFLVAVANIPHAPRVPTVLFEHNVEHLIWRRVAGLERRLARRALLEIEAWKVRQAERRACTAADLVVAVSEDDRRRLQALAPQSRCVAIPTGVDTAYFHPSATPEVANRLVFTGSMDWFPNEDAISYFIDAILPRIRTEVPGVTLSVVGRNPSAALRAAAAGAGVVVTGTVDDVRPYVDEAALYVVPLRAGGGTRLKIFEALAMGKAVVSTTVGAEGLAVSPGRDLAIADRPDEFARTVIGLLRDPERRQTLGRAGRQLVQRRYSWEQVSSEFGRYCESVARIRHKGIGTALALATRQGSS
jgi:glycosyltransferase involved in cell wall biosynthesis